MSIFANVLTVFYFVFFVFIVGIVVYLADPLCKYLFSYNIPSVLNSILQLLGGSLFSSSILIFLVQRKIIKEEIVDYFVKVFSSKDYVKNFRPSYLHTIFVNIVKAKFGHIYPDDFFSSVLSPIELLGCPYISSYNASIYLQEKGDKYLKTKSVKIELVNTEEERKNLWEYLDQYLKKVVSFEDIDDKREILSLHIDIDGAKIVSLAKPDIIKCEIDTTGSKKFPLYTEINWWEVNRLSSTKKKTYIKNNQKITITLVDKRTTSLKSSIIAHRIKYPTKNFHIEAHFENFSGSTHPDIDLGGTLFGNFLFTPDFIKHRDAQMICLSTTNWLLPGSGYVIYLTKGKDVAMDNPKM